jgi:hypothetical protein
MKTFVLVICCIWLVSINVNAQEGILDQQIQEYISTHNVKSTNANFYLTQKRSEDWQPYVDNLYRQASLYRNTAFGLMAVNLTGYVVMHTRISFGDYQTDDVKKSITQLNLIVGGLSGISFFLYVYGNNIQAKADRIINKETFSLQINENGIGIAYKF